MSNLQSQVVEQIHRQTTKDLMELAEANRALAEKTEHWVATSSNVTLTFTFFYEYLTMTLNFEDGTNVQFEGSAPGIGLGGTGGGHGYAVFNVSPQTLLSMEKTSFRASTLALGGGGIQVAWYEYQHLGVGAYLGSGLFVGLGVGGGIPLGGSGEFTPA